MGTDIERRPASGEPSGRLRLNSSQKAEVVVRLDRIGLRFGPPHNLTVLDEVSCAINAGEMIAIVGRSGAGKSSLLNIMGLLEVPTSGYYYLSGVETSVLDERTRSALRARVVGFVFQSFHLVPGRNAIDNIELGMLYTRERDERRDLALAAAERVGIGHRLTHMPSEMSGGERQRVAIARAIASRPQVLLADEPTGNLDNQNSAMVIDLLQEVCGDGVALVLVTHDVEIAARCDRAIQMSDGRASESLLHAAV